jgi:hypothetical protein
MEVRYERKAGRRNEIKSKGKKSACEMTKFKECCWTKVKRRCRISGELIGGNIVRM